jgi:zinc protease
MNNRTYATALIALLICATCLVSAANALEIKKEKLPSGLTVLYVQRHELPIVMATLLVKASPLDEDPAKAGTAYLTGKMLNEGTAGRKAAEISHEIEFIGGSLEAMTNNDYTTITLSVLKKDVDKGFDLFSDVVLHPTFPAGELARKKELVTGALKQKEEDPSFVAGREFIRDIFGEHPYGRLVEGGVESINAIEKADVINFYIDFYRPENAMLAVVGDISRDELNGLLDRYFSSWKGKQEQKDAKKIPLPPSVLRQPRVEVIDKDVAQANIFFGGPGISRDNPDYYAVSVMNYIFGGGGFASRLMKVIRDEMGLTYSINSFFAPNKYPGRFEVEVQTKNESAGRVIEEMLKQIRLIKAEPIMDQELQDAKDYLIGSFPRRLETSRKIADFLVAVQYYNLGDDYIDKYKDYIGRVTKEEVLRVARKYLNDENYVLVIVGNKTKLVLGK